MGVARPKSTAVTAITAHVVVIIPGWAHGRNGRALAAAAPPAAAAAAHALGCARAQAHDQGNKQRDERNDCQAAGLRAAVWESMGCLAKE